MSEKNGSVKWYGLTRLCPTVESELDGIEDDSSSEWSSPRSEQDTNALLRQIAVLQKEHTLLRNQMNVMAAFAAQPPGLHVHAKARMLQSTVRRHAFRRAFLVCRAAATTLQTAYRRHKYQTAWGKMISLFPERTKPALLARALEEKKRADELHKSLVKEAKISEEFRKLISEIKADIEFGRARSGGLRTAIDRKLKDFLFELKLPEDTF